MRAGESPSLNMTVHVVYERLSKPRKTGVVVRWTCSSSSCEAIKRSGVRGRLAFHIGTQACKLTRRFALTHRSLTGLFRFPKPSLCETRPPLHPLLVTGALWRLNIQCKSRGHIIGTIGRRQ